MSELKCKSCEHCRFMSGNGCPSRYYCEIAKSETSPRKMICRTKRHDTEFTIKRTPKWCPKLRESDQE